MSGPAQWPCAGSAGARTLQGRQVRHLVESIDDEVPWTNAQFSGLPQPVRHFRHLVQEVPLGTRPVDNFRGPLAI